MKTLSLIVGLGIVIAISAQTVSACCGSCPNDLSKKATATTAIVNQKEVKQQVVKKTSNVKSKIKLQEICLKCGQIKGSDKCCKPNQHICKKCGLVKGSPGCCKIPNGAKKAYYNPKTKKVVTAADCPYLKNKKNKSKPTADCCPSGACPLK